MYCAYVKFNIADLKVLCEQALSSIDAKRESIFQQAVTDLVQLRLRQSNNPSTWHKIAVSLGFSEPVEAITREDAERFLNFYKLEVYTFYREIYGKIQNLQMAVNDTHYQKVLVDTDLYATMKNWVNKKY